MSLITVTQIKTSYGNSTQFNSTIRIEDIRCLYPRHDGPGTRITFRDGGGFAVLDSFDAVVEAITTQFPNLKFKTLNQVKQGYGEEPGQITTLINLDAIRNFYPRHEGKPGTRLTFDDGGGFAVVETFDQVLQGVTDGSDHVVLPTPETPAPLQLVHNDDDPRYDLDEDDDAEYLN